MRFPKLLSLVIALSVMLAVPALATTVSNVQKIGKWTARHDAGTTGTSSGSTALTSSPSRSGSALHLATTYSNYGGERYSKSIPDDIYAHNFVYDAYFYIKNSTAGVKVLELDLNQVIGNGWTIIMGFQCDSWSGTWDYTANKGTAKSPNASWIHSGVPCNTSKWAVNKWHHVQIHYFRDNNGYVTYQSVVFDGVSHNIGKRVFSGFGLGWGKSILTNFQVDGGTKYSSGSHVYLDNLAISYW